MNNKLFNELIESGLIQKKKCQSKSHFLTCKCGNNFLRHFECKYGPVGLCYKCGNLFYTASHEAIRQMHGTQKEWWNQALDILNSINEYKEPYVSKNIKNRKQELINFFADSVREESGVPQDVSNEDIFESFSCKEDDSDELFYTDGELKQILLEYDSPESSMYAILDLYNNYVINEFEKDGYDAIENPENTWEDDSYSFLKVSKEMRSIIVKEIAIYFSEWVIDGTTFNITYDFDPPWDCSGQLMEVKTGRADRLVYGYNSFGLFLEECLTGEIVDGYEGKKFLYQTHFEVVENIILDILRDYWLKSEDYIEDDNCFESEMDMLYKVIEFLSEMSPMQLWILGKGDAQNNIDKFYQAMDERQDEFIQNKNIVAKFWHDNFKEINYKITKQKSKEFFNKFYDIAVKTDPKTLIAIKDVGLPGDLTDFVSSVLRKKVTELLKNVKDKTS